MLTIAHVSSLIASVSTLGAASAQLPSAANSGVASGSTSSTAYSAFSLRPSIAFLMACSGLFNPLLG